MKDILTIVDGNYLMIRSVMKSPNLNSSIGEPTGGIYLFLKGLYSIASDSQKIIVCFDGGHNKKRKQIFPEYKANRIKREENDPVTRALDFSFTNIVPLLRRIGILTVRIPGEEADDIIYSYAKHFSDEYRVTVASDDSDYLQMVSDSVSVLRPMKGDFITSSNFKETIGYDRKYHILCKALQGDKSDNIPNPCKGLGEVTALKIISFLEEEGLEPTLENLKYVLEKNTKKSIFKKLLEAESFKNLKRNLYLIDISKVADENVLESYIKELTIARELVSPNPEEVLKIFNRYEIRTLPQWVAYSSMQSNKD